ILRNVLVRRKAEASIVKEMEGARVVHARTGTRRLVAFLGIALGAYGVVRVAVPEGVSLHAATPRSVSALVVRVPVLPSRSTIVAAREAHAVQAFGDTRIAPRSRPVRKHAHRAAPHEARTDAAATRVAARGSRGLGAPSEPTTPSLAPSATPGPTAAS